MAERNISIDLVAGSKLSERIAGIALRHALWVEVVICLWMVECVCKAYSRRDLLGRCDCEVILFTDQQRKKIYLCL